MPGPRRTLPVDDRIGDILASLDRNPSLVLEAPPGTGKTTRVPPALLEAAWRKDQQILVLEPRRLAAKLSARFVASERGERAGDTIGYQFRFENVGGPKTRVRYLTEGTLVRWLSGNPDLRGVGALILDEFHERHVHTDVALAYARWLQTTKRPDLRVVVMSATLDAAPIAAYLGNCPRLTVEGRVFPVEIRHRSGPLARPLEAEVKASVEEAFASQERGDMLVFLPGKSEIRKCAQALDGWARTRDADVLPLHGELSPEEQDRAVTPGQRRKIILSTNVAETSLTIDGVTAVVDSGLHRRASHSWWSGLPALKTRPISRASAIQRAGRAGRTAPGLCLRLYTQHEFNHRPQLEVPELHRADLGQTVLDLKSAGVVALGEFAWFEPPPGDALSAALNLLFRLGALEAPKAEAGLTELGRSIARLPVGPRFGRVLVEAHRQGVAREALDFVAARLAGEDGRAPTTFTGKRIREQCAGLMPKEPPAPTIKGTSEDRLAFSLLAGFPDRVGRKRDRDSDRARARSGETELVLSGGGSARVKDEGAVPHHDLFVVLEAQEHQRPGQARSEAFAESLVPLREEWLFDVAPIGVTEETAQAWDPARKRVTAATRLRYDQITLTESLGDAPGDEESLRILFREALRLDVSPGRRPSVDEWIQGLARLVDKETIEGLFARAQLLHRHQPEKVPDPQSVDLVRSLAPSLLGVVRLAELEAFDWGGPLVRALAGSLAGRFDSLVPSSVTLARGRKVRVQYRWNQTPWIESRLQDFFGMKHGPSLLDGRVPLTLHLLAPNKRAVQVTTDLSGFWVRHYPDLRKTLKIRYPRHAWPEDPVAPFAD